MQAREVMTRDVQSILAETTLEAAWRLMRELGVRHLPVVKDGKLAGLLSDRDFLGWAKRTREGTLEFSDVTVGSVMTLNPVATAQGAPVSEMAMLMMSRQLDCLPIIGPDNALVGLVTSTDLMSLLKETRQSLPVAFRVRPAVRA